MFQILLHFVILLENMSPTLSVTADLTNALKKNKQLIFLTSGPDYSTFSSLNIKSPPPRVFFWADYAHPLDEKHDESFE